MKLKHKDQAGEYISTVVIKDYAYFVVKLADGAFERWEINQCEEVKVKKKVSKKK